MTNGSTGIRRRHSGNCRAGDDEGRCNCKAGFEAWVYLAREGKKIRKTFALESEAKAWRAEATTAARAGKLRTASRLTVGEAAWLWLEAAHTGAVKDRGAALTAGDPGEYELALRSRVLPEFGAVRLSELRRTDLQAFADKLLASGLSPSSVGNQINPLQAIFRHAMRRELVAVTPPMTWNSRRQPAVATGSPMPLRLPKSLRRFQSVTARSGRLRSTAAFAAVSFRPCAGSTLTLAVPRFTSSVPGKKSTGRSGRSQRPGRAPCRSSPSFATI